MNRIKKQTVLAATAGTMMLALTVGCGGSGGTGGGGKSEGKGAAAAKDAEKVKGQAGTGGTGAGNPGQGGVSRGYKVTTWQSVKVRERPTNKVRPVDDIRKGATVSARCWTVGKKVTAEGTTNAVWLRVGKGWASAIYFKGDKYGNVPKKARC